MTVNDICQEIIDCVALLKRELVTEKTAHEATKRELEKLKETKTDKE